MSMVVIKTLLTKLTLLCHIYVEGFDHQMWHMTGFQLKVNRDGYRMWGRKRSLFPEHLISLPLGCSWFHPFIIYTSHNLSVLRLRVRINDSSLFAWISLWISLTALSRTYFIALNWSENSFWIPKKNVVEIQGRIWLCMFVFERIYV